MSCRCFSWAVQVGPLSLPTLFSFGPNHIVRGSLLLIMSWVGFPRSPRPESLVLWPMTLIWYRARRSCMVDRLVLLAMLSLWHVCRSDLVAVMHSVHMVSARSIQPAMVISIVMVFSWLWMCFLRLMALYLFIVLHNMGSSFLHAQLRGSSTVHLLIDIYCSRAQLSVR